LEKVSGVVGLGGGVGNYKRAIPSLPYEGGFDGAATFGKQRPEGLAKTMLVEIFTNFKINRKKA